MSFDKATAQMRTIARTLPAGLPPMECGLMVVMLILAAAGSL